MITIKYRKNCDGYNHSPLKSISRKNFFSNITDVYSKRYYVASSTVKYRFFRPDLHLLLLDCDSTAEVIGADTILTKLHINHTIIRSSCERYWIVGDCVGTFSEMYELACSIPGVDRQFLGSAYDDKEFSLRLSPFLARFAVFSDDGVFDHPLAAAWYADFRALWGHPALRQYYQSLVIADNIKTGVILEPEC